MRNRHFCIVVVLLSYSSTTVCLYKKIKQVSSSFFVQPTPHKSIEQHIAHIYAEKPHLHHYFLQQHMAQPPVSSHKRLKRFIAYMKKHGIDIAMLTYCVIRIYNKHRDIYSESTPMHDDHYSIIANKILQCVPKNIINAPKHTVFFLDSVEIIVKAFLLKLIIKLLIFLVEVG